MFFSIFFFFNDTATTEIYTLSLHDALPIFPQGGARGRDPPGRGHHRYHAVAAPLDFMEHLNPCGLFADEDRKSTRLNSSHSQISYAVFCLKKKKNNIIIYYLHHTTLVSNAT